MERFGTIALIFGFLLLLWLSGNANETAKETKNPVVCSAESADPDACGYFQEQEWSP